MSFPEVSELLSPVEILFSPPKGMKYSHEISIATFKNDAKKRWLKKECLDLRHALTELIAQEFFRLIYPRQPKTQITQDSRVEPVKYFILSEEVPGYRYLPEQKAHLFSSGKFLGLGVVTLLAYFLQEIDLKNGNVGLDMQNKVIKVDGDWCFASFNKRFKNKDFSLSADRINSLPEPLGFYAYNWLSLVSYEKPDHSKQLLDPTLMAHEVCFRTEVNKTILRICLLSDRTIEAFILSCVNNKGKESFKYTQFLIQRRTQLFMAARLSPSFRSYLHSINANCDVKEFERELREFRPHFFHFTEGCFTEAFEALKEKDTLCDQNRALFNDINSQLMELKGLSLKGDLLLKKVISQKEQELQNNSSDVKALQTLKDELDGVLAIHRSKEFLAVKNKIRYFNAPQCFFSCNIGYKKKGDKILEALVETPVAERATLISHRGPANQVQKALATGRYGSRMFLTFDDNHEIVTEKAANSYQELRRKFC